MTRSIGPCMAFAIMCDICYGVQIIAVWPSAGQVIPGSQSEFLIDFSSPINPVTATSANVRLYREGAAEPTPGSDDAQIGISSITAEAGNTRLRIVTTSSLPQGQYAWVIYGNGSTRSGPGNMLFFTGQTSNYNLNAFKTLGDRFTLEAWTRLDDWAEYGSNTYGAWFDVGQNGRNVPGFYLSHERGDVLFGYYLNSTSTGETRASSALQKGQWRHLAAVSSPAGLSVYVDGNLASQISNTFRPDSFAASMQTALFGYSRWAGAYDFLYGAVDELRVWNIARPQSALRSSMRTPLTGSEAGLVLYYPLDESSGDVLSDITGHGYNGTRGAAARQASNAPMIVMPAAGISDSGGSPVDADMDGNPGGVLVSKFQVDPTSPRVVSVDADILSGVVARPLTTLQIGFDDSMDSASLSLVTLASSGGDAVLGNGNDVSIPLTVSYDASLRIASFTIASALPSENYLLTLPDLILNVAGLQLDGEFPGAGGIAAPLPSGNGIPGGSAFITFSVKDPPRVAQTDPAPSTRLNHVSMFSATFSRPVNPSSVTTDSVFLVNNGADESFGTSDDSFVTPFSLSLSASGLQATLTPAAPLATNTYSCLLLSRDQVTDDFHLTPNTELWQLNGNAAWSASAQEVPLGPALYSQKGSLFWKQRVLVDRFTAEFDFHYPTSGGPGDGFTFAFWKANAPTILGNDGSSLGLGGASGSGYAVEFDMFNNGGADPSSNHVALITSPLITPLTYTNVATSFATISLWHVRVDFNRGAAMVWLRNTTLGFPETLVINHIIPNFKPYLGYIGFTSSTGSSTNLAVIDNASFAVPGAGRAALVDTDGLALDGEFGGTLPSGNGTAGGTFISSFTVDSTGPLISSTSPTANSIIVTRTPSLRLTFNEAMTAASLNNLNAYLLRRNGTTTVLLDQPAYDPATRQLTLRANGGNPLADGDYSLRVTGDLLIDIAGNALDGNADGSPGGIFNLSFVLDGTPPKVTETVPAAGSTTSAEVYWLDVVFDSIVSLATAQAVNSYQLLAAGGDDNFNTGNEYPMAINAAFYDAPNKKSSLLVNYGFPLPTDRYRLTIRGGTQSGIKDLAGNWLDGNTDGTAGGDKVVEFNIVGPECGIDFDADGIGDDCDLCPNTIPGSVVDTEGCPPFIPGDIEPDGDVDAEDLIVMRACQSGSGVPRLQTSACQALDFDEDQDVDQNDFGIFQRCYSGRDRAGNPHCGG